MRITPKQLELASLAAKWLSLPHHKPGDRITEQQLTEALGVSRSPVRAIMPYLAEKRFLNMGAQGFFIPASLPQANILSSIPKSSDQKLFDKLIEDRARGKLAEEFSEAELIRRYKIARSQLTRVLIRLSLDGLVEPRKGQGWRFLPTLEDEKAYRDSYNFRKLIEPAGILESTFRQDDDRLRELLRSHTEMTAMNPGERGLFFDLNAEFHETIAEFSNNIFIIQNVHKQAGLRRMTEHLHFDETRMKMLLQEHIQVIEALLAGQREWAAALMKRHLEIAIITGQRKLETLTKKKK